MVHVGSHILSQKLFVGDCGLEGILVCSGGGFSLLWPIRGFAAGQGMVFDLSSSVLVISCESQS